MTVGPRYAQSGREKTPRAAINRAALAITIPGPDELGPCMQALSELQRKFVWAMLHSPTPSEAARLAGYSDNEGGLACRVRGSELMQRQDILDALHEVGWKKLYGMALKSIIALGSIVDDPDHPKHLIAVQMVLDRTGFAAQTEHKVTVEHRVGEDQMRALAGRLAERLGVPAAKLLGHDGEGEVAEVIEATVSHETVTADEPID